LALAGVLVVFALLVVLGWLSTQAGRALGAHACRG
jgi:hypothetical protein